jgi:hypothetical protein
MLLKLIDREIVKHQSTFDSDHIVELGVLLPPRTSFNLPRNIPNKVRKKSHFLELLFTEE